MLVPTALLAADLSVVVGKVTAPDKMMLLTCIQSNRMQCCCSVDYYLFWADHFAACQWWGGGSQLPLG